VKRRLRSKSTTGRASGAAGRRRPGEPRQAATRPREGIATTAERDGAPIAVAGVGVAADGFDACRRLLEDLPPRSGLAVVILPRPDSDPAPSFAERLGRHATKPVLEAADGAPVDPDHVYVVPPGRHASIRDLKLRLVESASLRSPGMPIDFLFRSLAEALGNRAIGILLSGTGIDGVLGAREIRAAGGMVVAQSPEPPARSRHGHPAAAIPDHVVPLEHMAELLSRYAAHPYLSPGGGAAAGEESLELDTVLELLRASLRDDFGGYKKGTVTRRVLRRMGVHHLEAIEQYEELLRRSPEEVSALHQDLLIGVTRFFRDPAAWRALEEMAIAPLVHSHDVDRPIRIWVPGCATGEEAYSLAMLLAEQCRIQEKACDLQVFASDLDRDALSLARSGVYPDSIAADVPPERLRHYFIRGQQTWRIHRPLRESVLFTRQNLISDPPFSRLDLISCRNLLIYLEPEVQKQVLARFHFSLVERGTLFLGAGESVTQQEGLFRALSSRHRVFRREPRRITAQTAWGTAPPTVPALPPPGARHPVPVPPVAWTGDDGVHDRSEHDTIVRGLESELRSTREDLRTKVEELETSNEELLTANEEVISVNEELLSANQELASKLTQIEAANSDMANLFSSADVAIFFLDAHLRVRRFTPAVTRLLPLIESDIGRPLADLAPRLVDPEMLPDAARVLEQLAPIEREIGDATGHWYVRRVLPYRAPDGRANGVIVVYSDITTRRRQEEALTEVNDRLRRRIDQRTREVRKLIATAADAVVIVDESGRILDLNPRTEAMFGWTRDELLGLGLEALVPERLRQGHVAHRRRYGDDRIPREMGASLPLYGLRRDGTEFPIDVQLSPMEMDDRPVTVATVRDLSELRQAEANTRRLAAIAESNPSAILVYGLDEVIRVWSPAAEALYGRTAQEMIGTPLRSMVPEDRLEEFEALMARLRRGELVQNHETVRLHRDGTRIEIASTMFEIGGSEGRPTEACSIHTDIRPRRRLEKRIGELLEQERERAGRELHDTLGQQITAIGMLVSSLKSHLGPAAAQAGAVGHLERAVAESREQVRSLIRGVFPLAVEPEGLIWALRDLAQETSRLYGVNCRVLSQDPPRVRDRFIATQLYLIVREATLNAARHSGSRDVVIDLAKEGDLLSVSDEGRGIPADLPDAATMGLHILAYRATLIGGHLRIESRPEGGTRVSIGGWNR